MTGNLGAGKSVVADFFKHGGAKIIEADLIAHELIKRQGCCYKPVVQAFGQEILDENKEIGRRKLAAIVFNDSKKLKQLNRLVHPPVVEAIAAELKKYRKTQKFIVVEAALLIEANLHRLVDSVIVVKANRSVQIKRAQQRLGLSRGEVLKRLKGQMPISQKLKYADIIVDNRGNLKQTQKQVEAIWQKLRQRKQTQ